MTERPLIRSPWVKWGLLLGVWTLVGLSFASQFYLAMSRAGRPIAWSYALSYSLADWYVYAALSVAVLALARRFQIERANWVSAGWVHLLASGLFALAYMALRALTAQAQGWLASQPVAFSEVFQPLLLKTFHLSLLIYWVIVSVHHAFDYYRQARERELRAAELEKHLVESRLQALQMQLNPHFFFNTLHSISALMHRDVEAADRMIARLSDLLRYALESTDAQEVPLRQELAFLDSYLEIEQTRFGDRLAIRKEINPATLDAWVPNLVLQPLVENAIRHGLEPRARGGEIELTARRVGEALELRVRDNGLGLPPGGPPGEGVGLANTRARLEHLYGTGQSLALRDGPRGGVDVIVTLPFRTDRSLQATPANQQLAAPERPDPVGRARLESA